MPEVNEKVMAMVEEELRKDPAISTTALYQKAIQIDPSIREMNVRQFNGRYPLQVKRRKAPRAAAARAARPAAATRRRPGRRAQAAQREQPEPRARRGRPAAVPASADRAVRDVLLQFAKEVAKAEGKADFVDV
ncbi:MAG TPA: hypothetical protein VF188_09095, partial [Longimicrobiales bacterium]